MFLWKKNERKREYFKERRFSGRKLCNIPCVIFEDEKEIPCRVRNISPYGLMLESAYPFEEKDILRLRTDIYLPPFSSYSDVSDVIIIENIWTAKRKSDSLYVAGFSYLGNEDPSELSWFSVLMESKGLRLGHEIKWRGYIRYPLSIPVYYDSLNGEHEGNATIVNISTAGLAMTGQEAIPKFTILNLRIGPAMGLSPVIVVGKVCWSAAFGDKSLMTTGIHFQIPVTENDVLFKYIEVAIAKHKENEERYIDY